MTKEKKKPNLLIKIGRRIKIKHLVLLVLLLVANSYAWFIFSTKVSMGVSAHIASWSIHFTAGDGEQIQYINFYVDRIYPGMDEASQMLYVNNSGTEPANLNYVIESVRIFDQEYEVDEDTTPQMLEEMLKDDFPFKFDFLVSSDTIESISGSETFKITLNWDYESGDDEADTEWGEDAYEYYAENPSDPAIAVRLKISAIQQLPEEEP